MKKAIALVLLASNMSWSACSNTNLGNGVTCIDFAAIKECGTASCASNTITSTTTGNLLIAMVQWAGSQTFACSTGLSVTGGAATWAEATHQTGSTFKIYLCYAANITGGTTAVTVNLTGGAPTEVGISVVELSGLATSTPVDVTNTGTGAGPLTFSFGPSNSTTQANEYAFCAVAMNQQTGNLTSATGGFTIEDSGNGLHQGWLDKALSATGTLTCGASFANNISEWDAVLGSFKTTSSAAAAGFNKCLKLIKLEE